MPLSAVQPPFVGRDREFAQLTERLAATRAGSGGVIAIAGDAGIGKTRLLGQLATHALDERWTILSGRAYQADGLPPYLPFIEALREYMRRLSDEELRERLGGAAAEVAVLVPEICNRLPEIGALSLAAGIDRYRLFEGITDFLLAVARSAQAGVLLALDDLHWVDTPSLLLLQHVARRLGGRPLLVAVTYRDAEVNRSHPLSILLADLTRDHGGEQVLLRGLSAGEVAHYIDLTAEVAVPAKLASAVYQETEGNPLFMVELVRLLAAEGNLSRATSGHENRLTVPHSVYQVIGRRLDRLSEACNQILTIGAVLGREFDLLALRSVSNLDGDTIVQALEEAERARVVTAEAGHPGRFSFTHPLIRETLYSQMLTTQRVRLHRQAAEALEALYSYDLDAHVAELAHHYVQASPLGEVEKAVRFARRAGDRAISLLAYEEAIRLYDSALQALGMKATDRETEVERCGLLVALGEAQIRAGETSAAKDTFVSAAELAATLDLTVELGRAALGYGGYRWTPGYVDERFLALADQALKRLDSNAGGLRARLRARLAMELYELDARERREALCRGAVSDARQAGDPSALAAALIGQHYALHEPANLAERLAWANEVVELAGSAGDRELALQGHYLRTIDLLESGEIEAVDAAILAHERLAQAMRQPLYLWRTELLRGMQATYSGRFTEAGKIVPQTYAIAQRAQIANGPIVFGIQLFVLRIHVGGLAALMEPQSGMVERAPGYAVLRAGLAMLYAFTGQVEEARTHFEILASNGFRAVRHNDDFFTTAACLAEVCVLLHDVERAALLYELLHPYADRLVVLNAAIGSLGPVARYLAILATLLERWDAAEEHFAKALTLSTSTGSPPYCATTRANHAEMLIRRGKAGDRQGAIQLAEEALGVAEQLGMRPLAIRLRALSTAAGSDQQVAATEGSAAASPQTAPLPDGLTEREAEVLLLLASGMTNREIGNSLVLSSRTVEHHVATIYRKTGARRRADAVAYALRAGLTRVTSAPNS